jgi:hypothetical protein
MNISEIMEMIDEDKICELGKLYKIDQINTKITGNFILKTFVYGALQGIPMSLRTIESMVKNNKDLASNLKSKKENKKIVDHSSIGKRLRAINPDFFKEIYKDIANKYHEKFTSKDIPKNEPLKKNFYVFDSTILSLSNKLLTNGLNLGGAENDAHIKMTISLKNSIPSATRFCHKQSESSENIALPAAINEAKLAKEDILLFDRGIGKAETFAKFSQEEKFFITRVNVNRKYALLSTNEIKEYKDDDLTISSDENVHLFNSKGREIKHALRLIKGKKANGDEIWFLSNVKDLSSHEIALAYKHRWQIEVLFKFLKQHLQFKTFVSYDTNGMEVYLYCLLIAAILFTMYKLLSKLTGYKIALLQFKFDLHRSIIKDIVLFCGGNPDLVDQRL